VKTLKFESLVVAFVAEDIAAGRNITAADAGRCAEAAQRIRAALEACQ
jgi:hypothetical protein